MTPAARPAHILVVDDREENRYILGHLLRRAGFSVSEARDGREALESVAALPDLVVLDVRLPDITGYEVCRRIKRNPATGGIPVLQLSASFVTPESKVQALEGGADTYLTQPVDPTVFIASVKALLRLRHAETMARLTARQWQTTFDALTEGIALMDSAGTVLRCNRPMGELLQCRVDQLEGSDAPALIRERFGEVTDLRPEQKLSLELSRQGRWYQLTMEPVRDETGEVTGAVLILADVSDRRRAEDALRLQDRLASTGRMAHIIAHEINNPLEALTNLLYLLDGQTNETGREYLMCAQQELDRVSRITRQTLSFNRDSLRPIPVQFDELLTSVFSLIDRDLTRSAIDVETQIGTIDNFIGHPGELRQILFNLVKNAVDAIGMQGRIKIRVRSAMDPRNGAPGVRILISDTGPGIPVDLRQAVFEPFVSTKELRGSGLGLWLSRMLVMRRGGFIRFRTRTEGKKGTCFLLYLPSYGAPATQR